MWQNKKIMTATALEQILRDQQEELFSRDESQLVTRREKQEFDLESQLAQIVIGVRRCGKSTLCQKVLKESGVQLRLCQLRRRDLWHRFRLTNSMM